MIKYAIISLVILNFALCEETARKRQHVDPFAMIDRHIKHSLEYHYLWPWHQLIRAAAALDLEESLEDPQIISDSEKYQVNLMVRRFKPDELKVKVKNRYIIVEGKHKVKDNNDKKFMANHFVQRFVLPAGTKQEEVKALYNERGILSITAPKHEIPPPPPEREVPIEVRLPEEKTEAPEKEQEVKETPAPVVTTTSTPLEQIETEATTHVGKIRKKELKTVHKTTKDNEVRKGIDGNGLDYALIETEE